MPVRAQATCGRAGGDQQGAPPHSTTLPFVCLSNAEPALCVPWCASSHTGPLTSYGVRASPQLAAMQVEMDSAIRKVKTLQGLEIYARNGSPYVPADLASVGTSKVSRRLCRRHSAMRRGHTGGAKRAAAASPGQGSRRAPSRQQLPSSPCRDGRPRHASLPCTLTRPDAAAGGGRDCHGAQRGEQHVAAGALHHGRGAGAGGAGAVVGVAGAARAARGVPGAAAPGERAALHCWEAAHRCAAATGQHRSAWHTPEAPGWRCRPATRCRSPRRQRRTALATGDSALRAEHAIPTRCGTCRRRATRRCVRRSLAGRRARWSSTSRRSSDWPSWASTFRSWASPTRAWRPGAHAHTHAAISLRTFPIGGTTCTRPAARRTSSWLDRASAAAEQPPV